MILTKGQENAIQIAKQRYKNKEPYTCIAGYAGSGKTSVVRFIIDAIGLSPENVVYVAYTGKASLVLKNKGCENVMTAHKLLYFVNAKKDGSCEFIPRPTIDKKYKMIVLDEASMLPEDMWDLLLSHKVYVLALGDPQQLPPVDGNCGVLSNPHAFLDEVVRQALDNPIIRLSMDVRNGKWIEYGGKKGCRVIRKEQLTPSILSGADQILCGKNITRHQINDHMRHLKFGERYANIPMIGDKVVCLKNYWNVTSSDSISPLINGMTGFLDDVKFEKNGKMFASFISDYNGLFENLYMDKKLFTDHEPTVTAENWKKYFKKAKPIEFDYGYALTVHKSQGSEWERVVVFDEWLGDKEYHTKWLYTAITRSSNALIIVK